MDQPFETAREVSENLLEKTGVTMLANDFDAFRKHLLLPQFVYTFEGQRYIKDTDDLRIVFNAVHAHRRKFGVTQIVRHCVEAEFRDSRTVAATHETRLINGHLTTQAPYAVFSVLKYNGTDWQVASSSYAIADRPEHNAALLFTGTAQRDDPRHP